MSNELIHAQTELFPAAVASSIRRPGDILEADYVEIRPRSLRDYFQVLRQRRWLAVNCLALTIFLTAGYTLATPRQYTASTLLEVPRRSPIQLQLKDNVLDLEASDRNVNGASSFLATQVTALKSRDLAYRVIRDRQLSDNREFAQSGSAWFSLPSWRSLLPAAMSRTNPGLPSQTTADHLPDFLRPRGLDRSSAGVDDHVDPTLIDRYMSSLDVQDVRGTDLILVRFTTRSPELSAYLAAAHTQAYLDETHAAQFATDASAVDFLERQLKQAREQLQHATAAVSQFATEHPNVAVNQEDKLIGQQITALAGLLTEAGGARVAAQSRYDYFSKAEREPLTHLFDESAAIQKLRSARLDLGAQRSAMESRLGPNHPQMRDLNRQAAKVDEQLRAEVAQEVSATRSRYRAAQLREDRLQRKLTELEGSAIALRSLGGQYDILKGELDNARALHDSLRKQQTETVVHSQLDAARVRVIERAEVPLYPSQPNARLNLLLGALAGVGIALCMVFVRDSLDSSLKSSDEVEEFLQVPALVSIPNFDAAQRYGSRLVSKLTTRGRRATTKSLTAERHNGAPIHRLVMLREPWSAVAESFRSLRTAVLFSASEHAPQVILVTSASASEGKTVTALNLATAVADSGSRVLLVDADLRLPGCHQILGVDNRRGLSTYLAGMADLEGVIVDLTKPRLAFLPAGPLPSNPAEMLGSARMYDAIRSLRGQYDFVILDSPPVLAATDAVVLGRVTDGVVLVVKGQDTPRDLVRRARDQLVQAHARLIGAVVNNVDRHWGDFYFYKKYGGGVRHSRSEEQPAA